MSQAITPETNSSAKYTSHKVVAMASRCAGAVWLYCW